MSDSLEVAPSIAPSIASSIAPSIASSIASGGTAPKQTTWLTKEHAKDNVTAAQDAVTKGAPSATLPATPAPAKDELDKLDTDLLACFSDNLDDWNEPDLQGDMNDLTDPLNDHTDPLNDLTDPLNDHTDPLNDLYGEDLYALIDEHGDSHVEDHY
jgi:hypothetical protein